VPINPNPVNVPAPIGSQAPPAPVGDVEGKHHPQSRREMTREAIRKAFARTEEPPKAAGSRMGHNQPPEPMRKERGESRTASSESKEGLDLKRRPDDQRPRAEHGHFAAPDGRHVTWAATAGRAAAGQPVPNVVALPAGAPYREPPKRWDSQAKAEWHAAPSQCAHRSTACKNNLASLQPYMHGEAQEFKRIQHFHQLAKSQGTTLDRALHNYVSMEQKLREDPIAGLDVIVANLNLRTPDGRRLTLPDIAYHILSQTPEQHQMLQSRNTQTALANQLAAVQAQQSALAQQTQKLEYARRFAATRMGVDRFAESHPRLDELGDLIQQELRLGFNPCRRLTQGRIVCVPPRTRLRPATHRLRPGRYRSQHSRCPDSPSMGAGAESRSAAAMPSRKPSST
jgi:hypothetical protein